MPSMRVVLVVAVFHQRNHRMISQVKVLFLELNYFFKGKDKRIDNFVILVIILIILNFGFYFFMLLKYLKFDRRTWHCVIGPHQNTKFK